jgi:hypothetical protein
MRHRLGRWGIALLVLAAAPTGLIAAQQALDPNTSPAQGGAQVIAQGLSELPGGSLVWRVVERQALPRGEAQPGERVTSYVIAREESILLTNVDDKGQMTDVAYLAPGEAFLVPEGTTQIRSSLSDQPATYISFELVPADAADQTGSGTLLFTTPSFPSLDGLRDVDLVANVLGTGEESTIPYTGGPVSIFATDGVIEITNAGGETTTLQPGDMAIFEGEVTIRGAGAASVPGVRAFAPLTQAGDGDSVYFASVIGQEVIPSAEFTPGTATPTPSPTPTQQAVIITEPTQAPVEESSPEATFTPTTIPTVAPTATATPDLASDDDQDGLPYRDEGAIGTDPNNPDTDGDDWSDGDEVKYETDPLDPNSHPVIIG